MRLDALRSDFLLSLRRRDLSPNTSEAYKWALDDLIVKNMAPAGLHDHEDLTRIVLERWQDTQIDRDWSSRSRSLAVTGTRQFIKYLIDREDIQPPVNSKLERGLARVKTPEGTPHPIPQAELDKLKAYFKASPNLRERALFFCLLTSGARISEALRMERANFQNPEVVQKGGTTKRLMMPPETLAMIGKWVASREDDDLRLWGEFGPHDARLIWKRVSKELGVPYFTTHALRHTCATELLRAGLPEIVIAEHLGHHGLGTIRNYAKVLESQRQNVVDVMSALVS